MTWIELKIEILELFHMNIQYHIDSIHGKSKQQKTKVLNNLILREKDNIKKQLLNKYSFSRENISIFNLILQYCFSVVSLEYRHRLWEYEYMSLSRRNGELWESFCKTAWDCPNTNTVRICEPNFFQIRDNIYHSLRELIENHGNKDKIISKFDDVFKLIGAINMKEDEIFMINDIIHVIDFKSGFGSNEKGNTLRLIAVGEAYKLWNPKTQLLILVRQQENNNYLQKLKRDSHWNVYCGYYSYIKIDEFTRSGICYVIDNIVDFEHDLSDSFIDFLKKESLLEYLKWR